MYASSGDEPLTTCSAAITRHVSARQDADYTEQNEWRATCERFMSAREGAAAHHVSSHHVFVVRLEATLAHGRVGAAHTSARTPAVMGGNTT